MCGVRQPCAAQRSTSQQGDPVYHLSITSPTMQVIFDQESFEHMLSV